MLVGEVIEVFAGLILASAAELLLKPFLDFLQLEGNELDANFAPLEDVKQVLPAPQQRNEGHELVAVVKVEAIILEQFRLRFELGLAQDALFLFSASIDVLAQSHAEALGSYFRLLVRLLLGDRFIVDHPWVGTVFLWDRALVQWNIAAFDESGGGDGVAEGLALQERGAFDDGGGEVEVGCLFGQQVRSITSVHKA